MPLVWLIRHAESEANAGLPTSDPALIQLTARGVEQAKYIASCFDQKPSLVVTSSYLRTQQTARPTVERFPGMEQAIWPVHEFTYLSPSRCQNTTMEDRRPMVEAYWERADPMYVDGEGAESYVSLVERVWGLEKRLRGYEEDDFVAIFSHGHFIRAFMWAVLVGSAERCIDTMRQFRAFSTALSISNGDIVKCMPGKDVRLSPVLATHVLIGEKTAYTNNE